MDENGYPINEDYLRQQGLNLVDMNRAYVEQQELMGQFNEFLAAIANPQTRMMALQQFDQELQQMQFQGQPQGQQQGQQQGQFQGQFPTQHQQQQGFERPTFPGGLPQGQQPFGAQDQGMAALQYALQMGNPMDRPADVIAAWNAVPPEVWRSLAPYLIREY